MKVRIRVVVALLLGAALPCAAQGLSMPPDSTLIQMDTPLVNDAGRVSSRADLRFFGGKEDLVYTNLGVNFGLGRGWEAIARGAFAGRNSFPLPGGLAAVRHGGNDIEVMAKYAIPRMPRIAGMVGVAFPDTPAQANPVLTLGGAGAMNFGPRVAGYANPRVALLDGNVLIGLGLGARAQVARRAAVIAEWVPTLTGDNTRSTTTGGRRDDDVFGAAVRLGPYGRSEISVDLGFTNGTGPSTGFGLTPGLGGSGAFYLAVLGRR